jgi:glycerophosphoryl diester phosphodiesterase
MSSLIDLGIDGLITDYPDRLRAVLAGKSMKLPHQYKDAKASS